MKKLSDFENICFTPFEITGASDSDGSDADGNFF